MTHGSFTLCCCKRVGTHDGSIGTKALQRICESMAWYTNVLRHMACDCFDPLAALLSRGKGWTTLYLKSAELVVDALPGGLVQHSGIINDIVCSGPGLIHDVKLICQRITGAQQ